nr:MAG TPA: hypothetical protein [Caudoviricetes sp.]
MSIFLTSFPYLDYIISRYTEKVKRFDKVFLLFFKKIGVFLKVVLLLRQRKKQ